MRLAILVSRAMVRTTCPRQGNRLNAIAGQFLGGICTRLENAPFHGAQTPHFLVLPYREGELDGAQYTTGWKPVGWGSDLKSREFRLKPGTSYL